NGYMDWDPSITDLPGTWGVTLGTRSLTTLWGVRPAPDSLTVDVTPRRTQQFLPAPGTVVRWWTQRIADGALVHEEGVVVDALGLVTVPAARVQHAGTRLAISPPPGALSAPPTPARPVLALTPIANPARGSVELRGSWPRPGQ